MNVIYSVFIALDMVIYGCNIYRLWNNMNIMYIFMYKKMYEYAKVAYEYAEKYAKIFGKNRNIFINSIDKWWKVCYNIHG